MIYTIDNVPILSALAMRKARTNGINLPHKRHVRKCVSDRTASTNAVLFRKQRRNIVKYALLLINMQIDIPKYYTTTNDKLQRTKAERIYWQIQKYF